MRVNRDKRIGRVLFVVEGSKTEFVVLRRIFINIFGYSYYARKRTEPDFFVKENDPYSKVAVINTKESNIRDISENEDFLDEVMDMLREKYHFPVDQSAVYYLFDRDPDSNKDPNLIRRYIEDLKNPYENDNYYKAGQLLLSYPCVESYMFSSFKERSYDIRCFIGADLKRSMGQNKDIQINKLSESTLFHATREFIDYLKDEGITNFDLDDFSPVSSAVFEKQENYFNNDEGFRLFSMLTLAFLQMGIIELDTSEEY